MHRAWVIVLLIALLPLRGWAAAGMVAAASTEATHATAPMPCHAQAPHAGPEPVDGGAAQEGAAHQGERATEGGHGCASCSLCHSGMAALAAGLAQPGPSPQAGPPAAHPRDTGRQWVALLERPPRA